jgi:hypothetical protein
MSTLEATLEPGRDFERRAVGRTTINRDVLMFFTGHECCVRNVTNYGADLRLNGGHRHGDQGLTVLLRECQMLHQPTIQACCWCVTGWASWDS